MRYSRGVLAPSLRAHPLASAPPYDEALAAFIPTPTRCRWTRGRCDAGRREIPPRDASSFCMPLFSFHAVRLIVCPYQNMCELHPYTFSREC